MKRARILKLLNIWINEDLRNFVDYDSYDNLISFFLMNFLDKDADAELRERCLESLIQ